jgi:hypothetical protein
MLLWKSPVAVASAFVMENLVQIARLVRLTRSFLNCPDDPIVLSETTHLAQHLYRKDCDQRISQIIEEVATIVPTRSLDYAALVPESYRFESTQTFKLIIRYYSFRIMLCGLLGSLCGSISIHERFNVATMRIKEAQAAQSIAMCADYALHQDPTLHLVALRMVVPLTISFGAWHRVEKRMGTSAKDHEHARRMKLWCLDLRNQLHREWQIPPVTVENAELSAEATAGGSLTPYEKRRSDPSSILASES